MDDDWTEQRKKKKEKEERRVVGEVGNGPGNLFVTFLLGFLADRGTDGLHHQDSTTFMTVNRNLVLVISHLVCTFPVKSDGLFSPIYEVVPTELV
jgi:hypothetical protein